MGKGMSRRGWSGEVEVPYFHCRHFQTIAAVALGNRHLKEEAN